VETVEESTRRNEWRPTWMGCQSCADEAEVRARLERYGVPQRVLHATLSNYDVRTDSQREALRTVRAWKEGEKPFLLLLGTCGTGKGHLAAALFRASGRSGQWMTHADLINTNYGVTLDDRPRWRKQIARKPFLVLDEMGAKGMTADTAEIFYEILDRRHDERLPTILIGNIPYRSKNESNLSILKLTDPDPQQARMESRMADGAVLVFCRWEDYRKKL